MRKIITLLIAIVSFASCEKESTNIERTESEFVTNLGVKFVFLNNDNEDLIDNSNIQTYPISFQDKYSEISNDDITNYNNEIYFNGNANTLFYDSEIGRNIWETIVYGFDNIREYKTFVHFENNDIDTILVKYSFTTDCFGRDYCASINEAYYNGNLIYSDKNLNPDFIYVTKTENQTSIKFE